MRGGGIFLPPHIQARQPAHLNHDPSSRCGAHYTECSTEGARAVIRRILVVGLGGVAGLVLWYSVIWPLMCHLFSIGAERAATRIGLYGMIGCVVGCGVLTMMVGEKIRIIPTQEQVDNKSRPVSLFSTTDQQS
jgi:hypothetical protein